MDDIIESNTLNIIHNIANDLSKVGGRAYFVGGYVRDKFMDISNDDIDIAIEGVGFDSLLGILSKYTEKFTKQAVGGRFACIIADINGHKIDFALCRGEKKSGEKHNEFQLDFNVSIVEDLKRRDLTINAIAIDILTEEVIDPFGGRDHIKRKVAQNVSNAFSEDEVRVIRAARFIARFKLKPTSELVDICSTLSADSVPVEMVGEEFKKFIKQAKSFNKFFDFLNKVEWIEPHFAEFKRIKDFIIFDVLYNNVTTNQKLVALLNRIGWQDSENFLKRNKVFSEKFIDKIVCIIKNHEEFFKAINQRDKPKIKKFLRVIKTHEMDFNEYLEFFPARFDSTVIEFVHELEGTLCPIVTGKDLIALGLTPGKQFKIILDACIDAQDKGILTSVNKEKFLLDNRWVKHINQTKSIKNEN